MCPAVTTFNLSSLTAKHFVFLKNHSVTTVEPGRNKTQIKSSEFLPDFFLSRYPVTRSMTNIQTHKLIRQKYTKNSLL